jgi:hypothetical protein
MLSAFSLSPREPESGEPTVLCEVLGHSIVVGVGATAAPGELVRLTLAAAADAAVAARVKVVDTKWRLTIQPSWTWSAERSAPLASAEPVGWMAAVMTK